MDFPLSFEHVGGPAIFLADMNNDGQIVGQRSNGGPDWNGLFLYDNGKFYDIELPPEFAYADVRGMNNKGQFVGMYSVQVGIDPFYGAGVLDAYAAMGGRWTADFTGPAPDDNDVPAQAVPVDTGTQLTGEVGSEGD